MSAPQAVGTILGLVLVTELVTDAARSGTSLLAVILIVLAIPFLIRRRPAARAAGARARQPRRASSPASGSARASYPDFGWTLLSRVLVNFGNAFGTTLLLYFLMFQLDDENAEDDLIVLTLIYMVFVILASLMLGRLSDRSAAARCSSSSPRRCRASPRCCSAFFPDLTVAMVGAGLLGLGYGCFLSVDQALATQVLPDPPPAARTSAS